MTDVLLFALSIFCFAISLSVVVINLYLNRQD